MAFTLIHNINGHYGRNDGYIMFQPNNYIHLKIAVTHQLYSYSDSYNYNFVWP